MQLVIYDGSFRGLLSAVFDVYTYGFTEVELLRDASRQQLFAGRHEVISDAQKAKRVWKGLQQKLSGTACLRLYYACLADTDSIDTALLQYIRYAFSSTVPVEEDYSNPAVLAVTSVARKVHREKHRMEAFIRFQLTRDQLFYAIVEPDFDVLPLIQPHFKRRYADQRWLVYDARRRYGIYYDLAEVTTVQLTFEESLNARSISAVYDEAEALYQKLWQQYFGSVNIDARKNTRLHIQHMPRRYWKYLPEKQP